MNVLSIVSQSYEPHVYIKRSFFTGNEQLQENCTLSYSKEQIYTTFSRTNPFFLLPTRLLTEVMQ